MMRQGERRVKKYLKLFGFEALFLLALDILAGLMILLQFVGKVAINEYTGVIFSGTVYRYNIFFYILGWIIFVAALVVLYKLFLKKQSAELKECKAWVKVVYGIIIAIFCFIMFMVNSCADFLMLGLGSMIEPDLLMVASAYIWPIGSFVYLIIVEIKG